jgi:formylmethanofuran dehydrogenase subunit E
MSRTIVVKCLCLLTAAFFAPPTSLALPHPHFHAQPSDPPWLEKLAQFHGHLGPSVVAGARLGMAGLRAVGANGYFDVEITCAGPFAGPPQSCFLDGVQVATGATLGKRNLHVQNAEQVVLRIRNTRTGKTAEVRPSKKLVELLGIGKQPSPGRNGEAAAERLERLARQISVMPDAEILVLAPAG